MRPSQTLKWLPVAFAAIAIAATPAQAISTWASMNTASLPLVPYTYRDMTTTRAMQLADAAWGPTPVPVQIVREDIDGELGVIAYVDVAPPGMPQDWTIHFDSADLRDMTWEMYETTIVHERGHLAGYDHSDNPQSIMYPTVDAHSWQYGIPRRLWRTWLYKPLFIGPDGGGADRRQWLYPMTRTRSAPLIDWGSASASRKHHGRVFSERAR